MGTNLKICICVAPYAPKGAGDLSPGVLTPGKLPFRRTRPEGRTSTSVESDRARSLARYANPDGNFVLVASGSFEANSTKKFIEIVYDLLIKAIQLGSLVLLEFGVGPVGLK